MKTRKDLIQLVKKWRIAPRIEMHKRTLTAVLKAHAETQKTKIYLSGGPPVPGLSWRMCSLA
ncbi:MAG: hypothetical protein ACYS3N_13305 [Planctomycetota bacterium]